MIFLRNSRKINDEHNEWWYMETRFNEVNKHVIWIGLRFAEKDGNSLWPLWTMFGKQTPLSINQSTNGKRASMYIISSIAMGQKTRVPFCSHHKTAASCGCSSSKMWYFTGFDSSPDMNLVAVLVASLCYPPRTGTQMSNVLMVIQSWYIHLHKETCGYNWI